MIIMIIIMMVFMIRSILLTEQFSVMFAYNSGSFIDNWNPILLFECWSNLYKTFCQCHTAGLYQRHQHSGESTCKKTKKCNNFYNFYSSLCFVPSCIYSFVPSSVNFSLSVNALPGIFSKGNVVQVFFLHFFSITTREHHFLTFFSLVFWLTSNIIGVCVMISATAVLTSGLQATCGNNTKWTSDFLSETILAKFFELRMITVNVVWSFLSASLTIMSVSRVVVHQCTDYNNRYWASPIHILYTHLVVWGTGRNVVVFTLCRKGQNGSCILSANSSPIEINLCIIIFYMDTTMLFVTLVCI